MKVLKWIGIIFVSLVVIGLFFGEEPPTVQDAAQTAQAAKQESESMTAFTAHDIALAYHENTVAADLKFKDKKFKVTGTVADINTDILGDPYITMKGGVNEFMEPQFGFDKAVMQQLADLKKGAKVTLVCTGKGDVAKTPMSGDCSLM